MTVKTTFDHPQQGVNQMFRPIHHSMELLTMILTDPRCHSGAGYRNANEREEPWPCRECDEPKPRGEFSNYQWQPQRKAGLAGPRCLVCLGQ